MRRSDREVPDTDGVFEIVSKCSVARLAMVDGKEPYMVAMNFGFERTGGTLLLYFHCATEGRKIDVLRRNPSVFFQMDCEHSLVAGCDENPCAYGFKYASVAGNGCAEFLEDSSAKTHALNLILKNVAGTDKTYSFPAKMLEKTCVIRVKSDSFTAKRRA